MKCTNETNEFDAQVQMILDGKLDMIWGDPDDSIHWVYFNSDATCCEQGGYQYCYQRVFIEDVAEYLKENEGANLFTVLVSGDPIVDYYIEDFDEAPFDMVWDDIVINEPFIFPWEDSASLMILEDRFLPKKCR